MSLIQALMTSAALHALLLALPGGTLTSAPAGEGREASSAIASPFQTQRHLLTVSFHTPVENTSTLPPDGPGSEPASISPAHTKPQTANPESPLSENAPESATQKDSTVSGGLLGLPTPYYYSRKELERTPQIIDDINQADGPLEQQLRTMADGGGIILELWINEAGTIDKIEPQISTMSPQLTELIISSFGKARFIPAQRDGQAVKSRMKIEVLVQPKAEQPPATGQL